MVMVGQYYSGVVLFVLNGDSAGLTLMEAENVDSPFTDPRYSVSLTLPAINNNY